MAYRSNPLSFFSTSWEIVEASFNCSTVSLLLPCVMRWLGRYSYSPTSTKVISQGGVLTQTPHNINNNTGESKRNTLAIFCRHSNKIIEGSIIIGMMMRIMSRRAQALARRLGSSNNDKKSHKNSNTTNTTNIPKPAAAEVPWPASIRYAFYVACMLAIPGSIGQALALSPRLRESLLTMGDDDYVIVDDDEEYDNVDEAKSKDGGIAMTTRMINYVRWYWGKEEYVPPIDLQLYYNNSNNNNGLATPGFRNKWEDDDYSSFLHLIGLYPTEETTKERHQQTTRYDIPMSLENEPCQQVRQNQSLINQYLNTGLIKVRFSLLPIDIGSTTTPCYETECSVPANITPTKLRTVIHGSNAQAAIRDLLLSATSAQQDSSVSASTDYERIRTHGWMKDCYWIISFPDDDNATATAAAAINNNDDRLDTPVKTTTTDDDDDIVVMNDGTFYSSSDNNQYRGRALASTNNTPTASSATAAAAAASALHLRRNTAIHSSWTYFPNNTTTTTAPLASSLGSSSSSSSSTTNKVDDKQLLIQKLQYQIQQIQAEINDSNSLRNIDDMHEEINICKDELRKLVPWFKRWSI